MVKVDPLRDYYADLELPKNADDADIKRQFRKLALRWHPDRNPGHEDEFNAKFQAIQAAHEILGDPVQRGRYDAERARAAYASSGFGSRPNPPPRNTHASYSNYPPPPRRPPARPSPAAASAAYPSQNAPGASRYAPFARTFYTGRPKEEPNARTNPTSVYDAYRAWENMNRSAAGTRPGPNPAPFPPPPRPAKPTVDPSNPPRPPPRRRAFDPSTPGGEAKNRHPYSHVERERHRESFEARRTNARSSPERRSQHASSRSHSYPRPTRVDDDDDGDDDDDDDDDDDHDGAVGGGGGGLDGPRLSTPYATRGGERTYLSGGSTLKRSATARGDVKGSPAERHRSASPIRNKASPDHKQPGPRKTSIRVGPSAATGSFPNPVDPPAPEAPTQQRRSRSHAQENSFAHYVPSDTSSESSDRSEEESPSFHERLAAAKHEQARRKNRHRHYPYPAYDPRQSQKRDAPDKAAGGGAGLGPPPRATPAGRPDVQPQVAPTVPNAHAASGSADKAKNEPPRYTFAVEDERYVPTQPATSAAGLGRPANINTQFGPADQHVKFTSNNADYFQHHPAGRGTPPVPRLSESNVGAAAPDIRSAQLRTQAPNNGTSDLSSTQDAPNPNISAQGPFKEDFWKEQLKQHSWEQLPQMPPSPIRPAPLHRQHSGIRQNPSRSARSGTHINRSTTSSSAGRGAAAAAAVDSSDEEDSPSPPIPSSPRNSIRPVLEEQSAMDIDVSTPPTMRPAGGGPGSTDVRPTVQVPDASQGRTGAGSAFIGAGVESARLSTPTTDGWSSEGPPPLPTRRSADTGAIPPSSDMDLGGFANVEPLAADAQGVTGVEDLRSSLPFPSRAAPEPPVTATFAPQDLELPPPPKAPEAPAIATQSSWEVYLATMRVYMYEWSQFIDRMLAHFNERQREAREGLTPNWLGMLGEGPGGGYLRYMQGVEEDFRVREHWDVAWEKHRLSMRAFGLVRNAVIDRGLKAA